MTPETKHVASSIRIMQLRALFTLAISTFIAIIVAPKDVAPEIYAYGSSLLFLMSCAFLFLSWVTYIYYQINSSLRRFDFDIANMQQSITELEYFYIKISRYFSLIEVTSSISILLFISYIISISTYMNMHVFR